MDVASKRSRVRLFRPPSAGKDAIGTRNRVSPSRDGQRERAAVYRAGTAVWEGLFGNAPGAERWAHAALELSQARDVEYGAGIAFALAQDWSHAQALANELERRFPEDTFVRYTCAPTLRALVADSRHDAAKSVQLLQTAVPYELAITWTRLFGGFGNLYPIYVRGVAYLASRRGVEAAAEFQKILDHRGIVVTDPVGALAHLQLGRALALSGDKVKAKAAYQDFLTLWKDADPDIPILRQAKAEYGALHRSRVNRHTQVLFSILSAASPELGSAEQTSFRFDSGWIMAATSFGNFLRRPPFRRWCRQRPEYPLIGNTIKSGLLLP